MLRRSISLALFAAVPAVSSIAAAAPAPDPTLLAAAHGAESRRNHFLPWHPIEPGKTLPPYSELTCEGGCSVRTADGSVLSLDPRSRVAVGQTTFIILDGSSAALGRRFELKEGSVKVSVVSDKTRPRTMLIGTPNDALIAVRPGEAVISAIDGRVGVACVQGAVRIKIGKSALELKPGQASSLAAAEPSVRQVSSAPKWEIPYGRSNDAQPLAVTTSGQGGKAGVSWDALPGASGYRVEVASDPAFKHIVASSRVSGKEHQFVAEKLVEGWYYARVTGFDADGLATAPSEPRPLRVISLQLPVGGFMSADGSSVVAPDGAALRLSDPTDLELAVDDRNFSPMPAQWVSDGVAHMLRFRVHGDFGHETLVQVTPRPLRAEIRMSPAWARWPLDPVDITVTLSDPSGRFDPHSVEPDLKVLVGLEEVNVDWKRDGNTFTARLPARSPNGPQVVRVIAKDREGALLGRNFLEVEPAVMRGPYADKALANR